MYIFDYYHIPKVIVFQFNDFYITPIIVPMGKENIIIQINKNLPGPTA